MEKEKKRAARGADYWANRNHEVGSEAWLSDAEYHARQKERDPVWQARVQERRRKSKIKLQQEEDKLKPLSAYAKAKGR